MPMVQVNVASSEFKANPFLGWKHRLRSHPFFEDVGTFESPYLSGLCAGSRDSCYVGSKVCPFYLTTKFS
jgi:hypothetical protein